MAWGWIRAQLLGSVNKSRSLLVLIFLAPTFAAQQPGRLLIPLVHSVAVSVRSTATAGCVNVISGPLTQQDAVDLLRRAGFKISEPPDAIVRIATDCGEARPRNRTSAVSVQ